MSVKAQVNKNENKIDVYVKHDFEIDDVHVGEMNEGNKSNSKIFF